MNLSKCKFVTLKKKDFVTVEIWKIDVLKPVFFANWFKFNVIQYIIL